MKQFSSPIVVNIEDYLKKIFELEREISIRDIKIMSLEFELALAKSLADSFQKICLYN